MAADVAEEKISKIASRIETSENENIKLKTKIFELIKENDVLNDRVAELEQYSKRENVIIRGISQSENEDLRAIIRTWETSRKYLFKIMM